MGMSGVQFILYAAILGILFPYFLHVAVAKSTDPSEEIPNASKSGLSKGAIMGILLGAIAGAGTVSAFGYHSDHEKAL